MHRVPTIGRWGECDKPVATLESGHILRVAHNAIVWLRRGWEASGEINGATGCRAMFVAPRVLFVSRYEHDDAVLASLQQWVTTPQDMSPLFAAVLCGNHAEIKKHCGASPWAPPGFGSMLNASHIAAAKGDVAVQHMLCDAGIIGLSTHINRCRWLTTQQRHLHTVLATGQPAQAVAYARRYPGAAQHIAKWMVQGWIKKMSPSQLAELSLAARWGTQQTRTRRLALHKNAKPWYKVGARPGPLNSEAIWCVLHLSARALVGFPELPPELWAEIASFMWVV